MSSSVSSAAWQAMLKTARMAIVRLARFIICPWRQFDPGFLRMAGIAADRV
jgi:hypothetical protein